MAPSPYYAWSPAVADDTPSWLRRLTTPLIFFAVGLVFMSASNVSFAFSETNRAAGYNVGADILNAAAWLFFAIAAFLAVVSLRRPSGGPPRR